MSGGRNVKKAKTRKMSNVSIVCTTLSALSWDWCLYLFLYEEKEVIFKAKIRLFFIHIKTGSRTFCVVHVFA